MPKGFIQRLHIENFTAFKELDIELSPGINIFIGPNATGKTHLLKLLYAAMSAAKEGIHLKEKLIRVFLPYGGNLGRLVHRNKGTQFAKVHIYSRFPKLNFWFPNFPMEKFYQRGLGGWKRNIGLSVYIPVKEMLANAPGFLSLYKQREIYFEEVYADLLYKAYIPLLKSTKSKTMATILEVLEEVLKGNVISKGEHFFLKSKQGDFEFTLVAEGLRKLALLWLLIRNGTLGKGTTLFWDEPEANLNPDMLGIIAESLLQLQREGVQIFLATHNYVLLKEFDLRMSPKDDISFHALHKDKLSKEIKCHTSNEYDDIEPNVLVDVFLDIYDREIESVLRGGK